MNRKSRNRTLYIYNLLYNKGDIRSAGKDWITNKW